MWHRDFPPEAKEMWDVLAKALMMRLGGNLILSPDEIRRASDTQAEISLGHDGAIAFRVETN